MRKALLTVPLVLGVGLAEVKAPVATVMSRAPFVIQGISVPVVGSTAWPAVEGDVIETKSAPAEVRLKDGTRIFMPAASRLVVSGQLQRVELSAGRIEAAGRATGAAKGAPVLMAATGAVGKTHNAFVGGVLNILDGGAFVVQSSMLETIARSPGASKQAEGANEAIFSTAGLIKKYGVNSPILQAIDQALETVGAHVTYNPVNQSFYITGVQVTIGNGAPQPATFIIGPGSIMVLPGTIAPGTPNPPPPLVTIVPPDPGSGNGPPGCKGTSMGPKDVSPIIVHIPDPGRC